MNRDVSYRITRWVDLGAPFDRLNHKKALSVMSVRPVSLAWLEANGRLRRADVHAFLSALSEADVLVCESSDAKADEQVSRHVMRPAKAPGHSAEGDVNSRRLGPDSLQRLRDWVTRPMRVEGRGLGFKIVFDASPSSAEPDSPACGGEVPTESAPRGPLSALPADDLAQALRDLTTVLLVNARSKRACMHLKVLQNSLLRGPRVADALPRPVIVLALVQLVELEKLAEAAQMQSLRWLAKQLSRVVHPRRAAAASSRQPSTSDADVDHLQMPEALELSMTDLMLDGRPLAAWFDAADPPSALASAPNGSISLPH